MTTPDRAAIAAKHRLPAELAGRLRGTTEAALDADARTLALHVAPLLPADGGPRGVGTTGQLTRADLAGMSPEAIQKAKADGRLDALLGIGR